MGPIWRLASVALGPLLLHGCAARLVTEDVGGVQGHITTRAGRPGHVVAAPHGTSDIGTGDIAAALARRTGYGLVVATGFSLEPDTRLRAGRRYQVNRPLEGTPGRPPTEEWASEGARRVYETYERRVRETAQGPLTFYTEIHGNGRRESAARIEVATVGVDRETALRLRTLLELTRDAHLRAHAGAPRLEILVEPADTVLYAASGAKRGGILRLPERALHVELPKTARAEWRAVYTAILGDFLVEAPRLIEASLLGSRP
jgi:hypothetical protein